MVLRIDDACVGLSRIPIRFMGKNRHDVRVGAVLMEKIRQCASSLVVQLMTEQQRSAAAHADFEQGCHDTLHAHDVVTDRSQRLGSRFRQGRIG